MKFYFSYKTLYIISLCIFYLVYGDVVSKLQPIIEVSEGELLKGNETFVLTCSVNVEVDNLVTFEWSYPNKNETGPRIRIKDVDLPELFENDTLKLLRSSLMVTKAKLSDSGIYICLTVDESQDIGFDKVFLPVAGEGLPVPPILNISSQFIDIQPAETLHISCSGKQDLVWKWPSEKKGGAGIFHSIVSNEIEGEILYKQSSTLTLHDVDFTDTGLYTCYYKGISNFSDNEYATSLYVFVNDQAHLFLKSSENIFLLGGEHGEENIPCLTTNSNANVSLWRRIDNKTYEIENNTAITFNHMTGFKIHFTNSVSYTDFQCRASVGNSSEELNVRVLDISKTYYDSLKNNYYQPVIDIVKNEEIAVGGRFALRCTVAADPDTKVVTQWIYPNRKATDSRIKEKSYPPHWRRVYNYSYIHEYRYDLTILDTKDTDSGFYFCLVIDNFLNIGWNKVSISVLSNISNVIGNLQFYQPLIYMEKAPNLAEQFILKCSFNKTTTERTKIAISWSYPNKNDSGSRIEESSTKLVWNKLGSKYIREITSYLRIKELYVNDSGIYTCFIDGKSLNTGWDKKWIFVQDNDERNFQVSLDTTGAQHTTVNESFTIQCNVKTQETDAPYIDWRHPSIDGNETRIVKTPAIRRWSKVGEYYQHEFTTSLTVHDAQRNDSGLYVCLVFDDSDKDIYRRVRIVVRDRIDEIQKKLSAGEIAGIIISIIFLACLLLLAFFITRYFRIKKNRKGLICMKENLFEGGNIALFNPNLPVENQIDLLPYQKKWEFPKNRLKFEKTLGQGAFGRVVKAEAVAIIDGESCSTVAVKMLKENAGEEQRNALVAELKILMHVGKHLNIVNLLGAVTEKIDKGELYVIVEYCCFGNIRHFLHKHKGSFIDQLDHQTGRIDYTLRTLSRPVSITGTKVIYVNTPDSGIENPVYLTESLCSGDTSIGKESDYSYASLLTNVTKDSGISSCTSDNSASYCKRKISDYMTKKNITTSDLLSFSYQCARGMEYLASKRLLHRDLAARNVLISKDYIVKICDFGLAKDCYKYPIYKKKKGGLVPMKWAAIESIKDGIFTMKSDVWSFGILLWEIFTLGNTPYPDEKPNEQFVKKLIGGYRMECPNLAPQKICEIMQECWLEDANQRPDFSLLVERIGSLIEARVKEYYLELNKPYQAMNEKLRKELEELELVSAIEENVGGDYISEIQTESMNARA